MSIEVGIPVYNARETLPKTLDSLVAQTTNDFQVCLSIDCDNTDYTDILNQYNQKLNIRIINGDYNGGPGIARQRVMDTTTCDFLTFVDSDDMLMPRAVEVLHREMSNNNYDIIQASFIREGQDGKDIIMSSNSNVLTWFHGKVYRVSFLREKALRFLPDLKADEDAHFNAVAWNITENKGLIEEVLYLWRWNDNSITRCDTQDAYFEKTYVSYVKGQVEALKKIATYCEINQKFITNTLIQLYYYCMEARFRKLDEAPLNELVSSLRKEKQIVEWQCNIQNWIDVINTVKTGKVMSENQIIFYKETFNVWAERLIKAPVVEQ